MPNLGTVQYRANNEWRRIRTSADFTNNNNKQQCVRSPTCVRHCPRRARASHGQSAVGRQSTVSAVSGGGENARVRCHLDSSDVWRNKELSMVSSLGAGAMAGPGRVTGSTRLRRAGADDCDSTSSGSSEELQYGPGIVSRLKHKYMSMALRETAVRPSLRRVASLEDVVETQSTGVVNGGLSSVTTASSRENMKRARSVGDLASGFQRAEKELLSIFEPKKPASRINSVQNNDENKICLKKWESKVEEKSIQENDLPLPDTVKTVKKLFECNSSNSRHVTKRYLSKITNQPSNDRNKKLTLQSSSTKVCAKVSCTENIENKGASHGSLVHATYVRTGEKRVRNTNSQSKTAVKPESPKSNQIKLQRLHGSIDSSLDSKSIGVKSKLEKSAKRPSHVPTSPIRNNQSKVEYIRRSFDSNCAKQILPPKVVTTAPPVWNRKQVGVIKPTPKSSIVDNNTKQLSPTKSSSDIIEKQIEVVSYLDRKIKETNDIIKRSSRSSSGDTPPPLPPRSSTTKLSSPRLPVVAKKPTEPFSPPSRTNNKSNTIQSKSVAKKPLCCEVQPIVTGKAEKQDRSESDEVCESTDAEPKQPSSTSNNKTEPGNKVGAQTNGIPREAQRSGSTGKPISPNRTNSRVQSRENIVTFNFTDRRDVPDYIENDGLIIAHKPLQPKNDSGYVLLPGFDPGQTSDDDVAFIDRPVSPCDVTFINADVIINGQSSLRTGSSSKKLAVRFDVNVPVTHHYLSEVSALNQCEQASVAAPTLGSLSTYTPSKSAASEPFQLGVSPSASANQSHESRDVTDLQSAQSLSDSQELLPAGENDTCTWSGADSDHLLF